MIQFRCLCDVCIKTIACYWRFRRTISDTEFLKIEFLLFLFIYIRTFIRLLLLLLSSLLLLLLHLWLTGVGFTLFCKSYG